MPPRLRQPVERYNVADRACGYCLGAGASTRRPSMTRRLSWLSTWCYRSRGCQEICVKAVVEPRFAINWPPNMNNDWVLAAFRSCTAISRLAGLTQDQEQQPCRSGKPSGHAASHEAVQALDGVRCVGNPALRNGEAKNGTTCSHCRRQAGAMAGQCLPYGPWQMPSSFVGQISVDSAIDWPEHRSDVMPLRSGSKRREVPDQLHDADVEWRRRDPGRQGRSPPKNPSTH